MAARVRVFGDWALQALMTLVGAALIVILAHDSLHFFLHDAAGLPFDGRISVAAPILEQAFFAQATDLIVARMEAWLSGLGVRADLVLYQHWKYAFVLLSLVLVGHAHVSRDFASRPALSTFRYGAALSCALLGGLMMGTAHLGHPGVVAFPPAAFLASLGLNSTWRCAFERELAVRIDAGLKAILLLGAAALTASLVLDIEPSAEPANASPGSALIITALMAACICLWAAAAGRLKARVAIERRAKPRWRDKQARRPALRVVAMLGLAGLLAGFGQLGWGLPREAVASNATPGAVFQDCPQCPDMVAIPGGGFVIGTTVAQVKQLQAASAWSEDLYGDELPARQVEVAAFALSRTEVTVQEFEAFLRATGYRPGGRCWGLRDGHLDFHKHANWRSPGYAQSPDHPVVCVSWRDAQAYVRWLSLHTGETYQLPTEAEWEYAARAGATTHYAWGDDGVSSCTFANGADVQARLAFPEWNALGCDDGAAFTRSVASYAPNAFSLFDMTGNVWEWVEDCYGPHDPDAASLAVQAPACADRVIRGGSWSYGEQALRSANREPHHPYTRGSGVGFRVAKAL